jgi:vancomycin resistance protein VanJ
MEENRIGREALRLARRALAGLAWLYAFASLYLAIVWSFRPDAFWWVSLSNLFAPLWFLPLLALLPLALLSRSRGTIVAATIPALLFLALFGALFVPRLPRAGEDEPGLRVVTFNQFFGNQQVDDVIAALRASDADVIAIQELSPAVAVAIEQQLAEEYPHRWLQPADHAGGLGLISRHPLDERRQLINGRGQQARLTLGDRRLTLINIHLHFSSIGRRSIHYWDAAHTNSIAIQVRELLASVDAVDDRLVIVGDFNMGERELGYRYLAATMRDAYREAGWGFGFTFPLNKRLGPVTVPAPLVRIDYAWLRGDLAARAAQLECRSIGADHCLVKFDLLLVNK